MIVCKDCGRPGHKAGTHQCGYDTERYHNRATDKDLADANVCIWGADTLVQEGAFWFAVSIGLGAELWSMRKCGLFQRQHITDEHTGRGLLQMQTIEAATLVLQAFSTGEPITVQNTIGATLRLTASRGQKATIESRQSAEDHLRAVKSYEQLDNMPRITIAVDYRLTDPNQEEICQYCGIERHSFEQCPVAINNFRKSGTYMCLHCWQDKGQKKFHDQAMCPFLNYVRNQQDKNSSRSERWNNSGYITPGSSLAHEARD